MSKKPATTPKLPTTPQERLDDLGQQRLDHDATVKAWVDSQLRQAQQIRKEYVKKISSDDIFEAEQQMHWHTATFRKALTAITVLGAAAKNMVGEPSYARTWLTRRRTEIQNRLAQGAWLQQSTNPVANLMTSWEFEIYRSWMPTLESLLDEYGYIDKAEAELKAQHPELTVTVEPTSANA